MFGSLGAPTTDFETDLANWDKRFAKFGSGGPGDTGASGTVPIKGEGDSLVGSGGETMSKYIADNQKSAGRPLLDAEDEHYLKGLRDDITKNPRRYGDTVEEAVEAFEEVNEMLAVPPEESALPASWADLAGDMLEPITRYETPVLHGAKRSWFNPKRVFLRKAWKEFEGASGNEFSDWMGVELTEFPDSESESEANRRTPRAPSRPSTTQRSRVLRTRGSSSRQMLTRLVPWAPRSTAPSQIRS